MVRFETKDLIQVNATVIAGLLVLFTISSVQGSGDSKIELSEKLMINTVTVLNPLNLTIRFIVMGFAISSIIPLAYSIFLLLRFYRPILKMEMEHDIEFEFLR